MVTGFEEQTCELREYELTAVPTVIHFIHYNQGRKKPCAGVWIISQLKKLDIIIRPARLRKIIHYIRINGLIENLVASSKGYFIAESEEDCRRFIESLDQRANAIISIRDAMEYQMKKKYPNN